MDNNINIFFNEKNDNDNENDNENENNFNINDFTHYLLNNDNNNDFLNNNNQNNFYESFLLETDKLTKYDAIRAGYGEMLVLYYDEQYVVADLLRICDYYGLLKTIKSLKCKKQEIINIIVLFETNKENEAIVKKRHQLWSYIMELKADKYMKQFIAF